MLSEKEILNKLYAQPEIFNEHISKKEYAQASYCVECARVVALFIELSEEQLVELFGSRQNPENVIEGLFSEEKVLCAEEWCIFHNKTRQDLTRKDREERERVWRETHMSLPAKKLLTRLKDIDKLIASICKEMNDAEQNITPSASRLGVVPSVTNGISNPTEKEAVSIAELQEQLRSYRDEYVQMKIKATRLLNKIENNKYQRVLYNYYLQNMTLYETAEKMNLSYQRVCALRDKAVVEFQRLMDEEEREKNANKGE